MSTEPTSGWNIERLIGETFVADVELHQTLASTNDRALQLATLAPTQLPLLIIAEQQTRGRGRGANTWWSAAGSLTFSLLLQLDIERLPTSRWPQMSLSVGSSICEALARLLPDQAIGLKWPNDVYLQGAKLCGVLVEIPPAAAGRVVIGVGLNVANSGRNAPAELAGAAIALSDVGGPTNRQDVLVAVLQELAVQLDLLVDDPESVRRSWRRFDMLIGQSATLADGHAELTGTCVGIDDDGALLLRSEAGTHRCYGGVVQSFV